MTSKTTDVFLTALAPATWGASYIISTELLPGWPPLLVALLRALPTGLVLLAITRTLPPRAWIVRIFTLGALNFTIFWAAMFYAAYHLPGGVAATLGAVQPLFVLFLSAWMLGSTVTGVAVFAAVAGVVGVALLILGPEAQLDWSGIIVALIGAVSMGLGTVLSRRWQRDVPPLTFAAWQLTAGGVLLVPVVITSGTPWPVPDVKALIGLAFLGVIGASITYMLFFRGIARLGPAKVSSLGFLSPLSAVLLGWIILGQALGPLQIMGALVIVVSVYASQKAGVRS